MKACKHPLRVALLVAALAQIHSATVTAADKKDASGQGLKACDDCPDVGGLSGWVEGGLDYQSHDSDHFGRYTGHDKEGAGIVAGADLAYLGKEGTHLDVKAVDLGLVSRDIAVSGGKQGKYEIGVEYDQMPNFRTETVATRLKTQRDRSGIKFSMVPDKAWDITGFFRYEEKEGVKDVGATFGFTQTTVLPAPVDYETDDFGLSAGFKGERLQAQFSYAGSLFRNKHDSIVWSNSSGRIAEAPDNQFHQLSATLGYQLSDATRLAAHLAYGQMTQNESFQPYSINSGANAAAGVLPAASLDGKVDTTLAKVELNSRPTSKLRLDASYAYSNRDNKTPLNIYNYVVTDIGLSQYQRQNRPYGFEQQLARLKAGYRLGEYGDLSGGFDYDRMNRSYQQVEETQDRTVWGRLKLHPLDSVDASLKVAYSDRNATNFVPLYTISPLLENPQFHESVNPLMQAFELAERKRNTVGFELAVNASNNLTLGLDVAYNQDDYQRMVLGLNKATSWNVTPSVSYAFTERFSGSAYYTLDKLDSEQTGHQSQPLTTPDPWLTKDVNRTDTFGLTFNWKAIPKKLDIGADLAHADFTGRMQYAGAVGLPNVASTMTAVGMHGTYRMQDNLSLRAGVWYEYYKETDWSKTGVVNVLPTLTSLGYLPQNVNTTLVSVSARYDLK